MYLNNFLREFSDWLVPLFSRSAVYLFHHVLLQAHDELVYVELHHVAAVSLL